VFPDPFSAVNWQDRLAPAMLALASEHKQRQLKIKKLTKQMVRDDRLNVYSRLAGQEFLRF
jgi:hypothetical protein